MTFGGEGFPAFSEQTTFALSSVQDLFVNFCFALRLQPMSLSFVALFSQIFCPQPINNKIAGVSLHRPIFKLNIWSHTRPNFGSFGHLPPLHMSAILNLFHLIMIETTS